MPYATIILRSTNTARSFAINVDGQSGETISKFVARLARLNEKIGTIFPNLYFEIESVHINPVSIAGDGSEEGKRRRLERDAAIAKFLITQIFEQES